MDRIDLIYLKIEILNFSPIIVNSKFLFCLQFVYIHLIICRQLDNKIIFLIQYSCFRVYFFKQEIHFDYTFQFLKFHRNDNQQMALEISRCTS